MSAIDKLVANLKSEIGEVTLDFLDSSTSAILLDCREREEVELGIIPSAQWLPKGQVELVCEKRFPDKKARLVVYCASGYRSILVVKTLRELGYESAVSLRGGIQEWKDSGQKIAPFKSDDSINRKRYLSQLRVPEISESGQRRIQNAKVLIVGAGGLGSPASLYLAACGIGEIGIVDADVVDESNLQRQILHTTDRIGLAKVDSAFLTLKSLNPNVKVSIFKRRLSAENCEEILSQFDLVLDCSDNFETRYLVNTSSVKLRKANVHGSVVRLQGQVTVFGHGEGPCYQCLFPEAPTAEYALDCATGGVLGAVVGVIGSLMAVEAIKIVTGAGSVLSSRLISYDGLTSEFESLEVLKDGACGCCGVQVGDDALERTAVASHPAF